MWYIKNSQLAKQGITAVLLFGIASGAGAQQMQQMQPIHIAPNAGAGGRPQAPSAGAGSRPQKAVLNMKSGVMTSCASSILRINGRQGGNVFTPGDVLNIDGCGFVGSAAGAQAWLNGHNGGGVYKIPLIIDAWSSGNIRAHIDAALSGVPDLNNNVTVDIQPSGAPVIELPGMNSFRAARVQFDLEVYGHPGLYSLIYGYPDVGGDASVTRDLKKQGTCPVVTNQQTQMVDSWLVDFLRNGFEVVGVKYENEENSLEQNHPPTKGGIETVVGNEGGAYYDAAKKRVFVTFQGRSIYWPDDPHGPMSECASYYILSMTVSGPRGFNP